MKYAVFEQEAHYGRIAAEGRALDISPAMRSWLGERALSRLGSAGTAPV